MPAYPVDASSDEQIPAALRGLPAWGVWSEVTKPGGKPSKVPKFNTAKPETLRTWAQIEKTPRWSGGGVGFCATGGYLLGGLGGGRILHLDIDSCRVPQTGEIVPEVVALLAACEWSYTEVSPSGYGLRAVVAVADLAADCSDVRATCRGTWAATKPDKAPGVQIFGLGPAGYVTMTGERLEASSRTIRTVATLQPILAKLGMLGAREQRTKGVVDVVGSGPVPSGAAITAAVAQQPYGPELTAGDWHAVPNAGSASEGFHLLARLALAGAGGHGQAAVDWLLGATPWGRGAIHDSKDPSKYMRADWVAKDVARAAAKAPPAAADVFTDLPMPAAENAETRKAPGGDGDPGAVADLWERDGPLTHLPTGIDSLDELTGGGIPVPSRVYMLGAPNAGKTALAVQLADYWTLLGVPCGYLGVDEEPADIALRLMQRRGWSREDCEARTPDVIAGLRAALGEVPLQLFDDRCTIEAAAVALHRRACELHPGVDRPPCVLFIDSVQTARGEGEDIDGSGYANVTRRVAAIRACAARYRMLVIATSEMNRAAYKSKKVEDQVTDMAAGKESGAIEFSARVLLALRSVPGSADVCELRVVKNKHGRDHRADEDGVFLRLDRATQTLEEAPDFEPLDAADALRAGANASEGAADAARVAELLLAADLGVTSLVDALRVQGVPKSRARAARERLVACGAIEEYSAPKRGRMSRLLAEKLPEDVAEEIERRRNADANNSRKHPKPPEKSSGPVVRTTGGLVE